MSLFCLDSEGTSGKFLAIHKVGHGHFILYLFKPLSMFSYLYVEVHLSVRRNIPVLLHPFNLKCIV